MDDLSSLTWKPNSENSQRPQPSTVPAFTTIRPTPPLSRRSTPLSAIASQPPSKPSTPANDTFSNLVSFGSSSTGPTAKNLSLQEQQKRREEAKRQEASSKAQPITQFGSDAAFWDNLGSSRKTPFAPKGPSPDLGRTANPVNTLDEYNEDDLLAGFSADTPVDSSTNFPKPTSVPPEIQQESLSKATFSDGKSLPTSAKNDFIDDDDPFGLSEMATKRAVQVESHKDGNAEDDVLGLLAQPVSNFPKPSSPRATSPDGQREPASDHPQERAIAELVEMGFEPEKARQALESTESGIDVQNAVGWLLNQAHSESRRKQRPQESSQRSDINHTGTDLAPRSRQKARGAEAGPAWMVGQNRPEGNKDRTGSRDRDPTQVASELSSTFMKTAGSLWKAGSKKVQQAMQDLNSDSDSSQPKWMRDSVDQTVPPDPQIPQRNFNQRRRRVSAESQGVAKPTDEALMLESNMRLPAPRKHPVKTEEPRLAASANSSRDHSPAVPSRLRDDSSPKPAFLRQQMPAQSRSNKKSSLNRQAIEDEAAQAYVSSARRRPKPVIPALRADQDLLETPRASSAPLPRQNPASSPQKTSKSPAPILPRPAPLKRTLPLIDPITLSSSHRHRLEGASHFKRGDYSAAHTSYASALRGIPQTHPLTIILLTNHALTSLKVGEPKQALSDCDNAISVIGPSQGTFESIDLQSGEPPKPMRDFYGKALIRKAEALEQMEKWRDAAAIWQEAVSAGQGGATSIQGRQRCEKAAGINQPAPTSRAAPARKPITPVSKRPAASSRIASDAAVTKLRAANAAAEKADDEKFRLADIVDAKTTAWKGGKADNLRALLSSLDKVLWPEANWKGISMADLVLPGKVKVQYMKGIAKVHPDKVRCFELV